MINPIKSIAAIMLTVAVMCVVGCKPEDDPNNGGGNNGNNDSDVRVTTYMPQDITATTAKCGGDVIAVQGLSLSELGVCWSKEQNPTIENAHVFTTNWREPYVCIITDLEPETKYYVRAYALRGLEYYYGEDKSFTTESLSYVDLGLPSGTVWATCNVGANTPEEYGEYYAWGETAPKTTYNWSTYQYCNGGEGENTLTMYCNNSNYGYNGFTDNLTTLLPEDDVATVNWGSGWCTPTHDQWRELYQNTTHTWTTQNGVNGRLFTANNGNSLFLPAAGWRQNDILHSVGYSGEYWSSSLLTVDPSYALYCCFVPGMCRLEGYHRSDGRSVRPVRSSTQK